MVCSVVLFAEQIALEENENLLSFSVTQIMYTFVNTHARTQISFSLYTMYVQVNMSCNMSVAKNEMIFYYIIV